MASLPIEPEQIEEVVEPEEGMDDNELASLLAAHESAAIGYYNSEIANEQAKAIDYYYGRMDDVPAPEGGSKVVDHTVAVMVDNALAAVLKPFVSADEVVSFEPRGAEDVEVAKQATEYVNYVVNCDNPGFQIFHDWFKDALLTKIGVVKVWWEDQSRTGVKQQPVDAMGLMAAREDPNYLGEQEVQPGVFAVSMQEIIPDGRVKIEGIPPEEFLISPFARSIESAGYVAHRPSNFTRSDLIEMGVDRAIVDSLPASAGQVNEESRSQARYRDEDWSSSNGIGGNTDKSRDVLDILDEYVRVDYDGDGVAELRRVVRVGDVILLNEEVREAPFALLCPCPMPHKVYGRSTADQTIETQRIATAVTRQTLDNLYKSNNPRPIIGEAAVGDSTSDDLADSSPGAEIRVNTTGEIDWLVVPFNAQHSFPMLEYVHRQGEERSGFQRKGNGFNAAALEKNSPDTATQAAIDENSRNERAEMIARIFAETGVRRLFKLVLHLLTEHQPRERIVRLRNQWVPMDPAGWDPDMDVTISVGLGVGNKAEQIGQASSLLEFYERIAASPFGYLVSPEHVHAAAQRLFTALGIKDVDNYIGDPSQMQPPEPQPDPEMVKAQMQMQVEQAKLQSNVQAESAKIQLEQVKASTKLQLESQSSMAKLQLEQARAMAEAQLAREKAQFEAQLATAKMQFEQRLAEQEQRFNAQMQAKRAQDDADIKMSKNRPGGDLSK